MWAESNTNQVVSDIFKDTNQSIYQATKKKNAGDLDIDAFDYFGNTTSYEKMFQEVQNMASKRNQKITTLFKKKQRKARNTLDILMIPLSPFQIETAVILGKELDINKKFMVI